MFGLAFADLTDGWAQQLRAKSLKHFNNTTPEYWQNLKTTDPNEAAAQLRQYLAAELAGGGSPAGDVTASSGVYPDIKNTEEGT